MTKSTISRERLQEIAEDGFLKHGESKVLARMALSAMDSEPVAWTDEEELRDANESGSGYLFGIERDANKFADPRRQIMLYRHAQPAPVVPDGIEVNDPSLDTHRKWMAEGWNRCRAAILQENQKSAGASNNCRSSENVQVMNGESRCSTKGAPALDSSSKNAKSRGGNSQVIPDGYVMVPREPTDEMQSAGASAIRIETTALNKLWTGNAVFRAMLAAAPQEVR
ncbi:hypothetical protein [Klebsiella aerogenes]|uniref:hypothetical protein n=1 Tax=Klebsiella aerogenes TaxID=548 RepID=UPI001C12F59D|nr:hypothetical protein [Klebsiella aerogenes]